MEQYHTLKFFQKWFFSDAYLGFILKCINNIEIYNNINTIISIISCSILWVLQCLKVDSMVVPRLPNICNFYTYCLSRCYWMLFCRSIINIWTLSSTWVGILRILCYTGIDIYWSSYILYQKLNILTLEVFRVFSISIWNIYRNEEHSGKIRASLGKEQFLSEKMAKLAS